jgi:hypothetical protein
MTVDRISQHNSEVYRNMSVKRLDKRHEELVQEERRVKHNHEVDEAKRIEMNRRMNRPGQNVDRMA